MNTAVALSPIDRFRMQVLPPDKAQDLWRGLPSHITPAVYERNLTNALMHNPDLLKFDPRLVYREVSKAAGLGLLLDPQLGEAYIVVAYNYKTRQKEPQLRIGYRGMCKLARQTGNVKALYAHEVCEHDEFDVDQGWPKKLHHRPNAFGTRGEVIGYFALIGFADAFDFELMSVEQARAIRNRSDAWKAYKEEKIKSTPWSTDEGEMSKKTVLRRLLKRQDLSPEMRTAIEIEDRAEYPEMRTARASIVEQDDDGPPAPNAPQIEHTPGEQLPMQPITEAEAVDLVEAGAHPPGEQVIWADDVPLAGGDDEPPSPNSTDDSGAERSRTSSQSVDEAAPAKPPISDTQAGAAFPLQTRAQLVDSINTLKTYGDCLTWPHNFEDDLKALSEADRREVIRTFNSVQAKLKEAK